MQATVIGNVMPVLEIALNRGETLIAESGELSWMTESIQLRTSTQMAGATGIFGTLKTRGRGFVHDWILRMTGRVASCSLRNFARWPAVDCSDPPTATMTQDYLRPRLTNASSCLQAARMLSVIPLGALGRGGVRDESVHRLCPRG